MSQPVGEALKAKSMLGGLEACPRNFLKKGAGKCLMFQQRPIFQIMLAGLLSDVRRRRTDRGEPCA